VELRTVRTDGFSTTIAKIEERSAPAGDFHLGGESGSVQFLVPREQSIVQCDAILRSLTENGLCEPVKTRVERVEDDQPVWSKDTGK